MRKLGLIAALSLAVVTGVMVLVGQAHLPGAPVFHANALEAALLADDPLYLPVVLHTFEPGYQSPFGIVMYGGVDDPAGLQLMKDAGIRWVSTSFQWSEVEPARGIYDWSGFDARASSAQASGMSVFVLFTGNPSWAAVYPGGPVTNTEDLVNIVTRAAERYDCDGTDDAPGSPCVHYWSFYAEPDNGREAYAEWGKGWWGHNGVGYAELLSRVSPAIHTADPRARVLIGGLAYDYFEPQGPYVRSFLTDTLEALNAYPGGARAYLDAVAFHYYPITWSNIVDKALELRSIMANHDVGDVPLLSPEMGFWSSPNFGSSEDRQAGWLARMYVRSLSVNLGLLSWYKVYDVAIPGSPEDVAPDKTCGLVRVDGTLKPSYYAYQTLIRELMLSHYLRPLEAPGIEGYIFAMPGGKEKGVLWAQPVTTTVTFPHTHLRVVETTGTEHDVLDGGPGDLDGSVNGQIELQANLDQPIYLEVK